MGGGGGIICRLSDYPSSSHSTFKAMADHDIRHAKIIEALEAEKRKIAEEFAEIQRKRALRSNNALKMGELS